MSDPDDTRTGPPAAHRAADDPAAGPHAHRGARWRSRLWVTVSLLVSVAIGLVAFGGFANHTYPVGPGRITAEGHITLRGQTEVVVPPFGAITARTHAAPLGLRLTLAEVDLDALQELAAQGVLDPALQDRLTAEATNGVRRAIAEGLLAAAVASGLAGWALRHRWRVVAGSVVLGTLVPAALLGWAATGYDPGAFTTPSYRGAVSYAPSLIELVQRRAERVDDLRRQVEKLVRDLDGYYRSPQSFASGGALPETVRVLHVSDIHLDPVGLALTKELAEEFAVSFIIDTGDINHYGSTVEGAVAASQVPDSLPYLFVPGNHDSPEIVAALGALENVRVLDETRTAEAGITVFGVADPASRGAGVEADRESMEREAAAIARRLRTSMRSGETTPTIVALHNPAMAAPFEGIAPLVLLGHTHTPDLTRRGDTWFLDNGTTGGIHFSDTRPEPHIPHSASILYFTAEYPRRLVAIDQIEVSGIAGQSSLRRTVIDPELLGASD